MDQTNKTQTESMWFRSQADSRGCSLLTFKSVSTTSTEAAETLKATLKHECIQSVYSLYLKQQRNQVFIRAHVLLTLLGKHFLSIFN